MKPTCSAQMKPDVGPRRISLRTLKLQPQREHQQNHAELGEGVDALGVGEQRNRHVGPDNQAGDQIADHDRLANFLKDDGGDGGDAQHHREIFEERV